MSPARIPTIPRCRRSSWLKAGVRPGVLADESMKEFSCGDVVPGCIAKFRARSQEEILEQVAAHAHADHGLKEVPPELANAVLRHIHDSSR